MSNFKEWSDKLGLLLKQAEGTSQDDNLRARLALIEKLTDFVVESTPNTPDILALDEIAQAARRDLTLRTIDERIASITSRNGDLVKLRKQFGALAADAHNAAASINLEQVQKTVGSLTSAVLSLKELKGTLTSGQHEKLAGNIESVLSDLQKLRSDVEEFA